MLTKTVLLVLVIVAGLFFIQQEMQIKGYVVSDSDSAFLPIDDADINVQAGYADEKQLSSPQQQQMRAVNVPIPVYLSIIGPIRFELGAPQAPSAHHPGCIEYGREYLLAFVGYNPPVSFYVLGLGTGDPGSWSGLRVVRQVTEPFSTRGDLAAFGNRLAYVGHQIPYEFVLGNEAGCDGLIGTSDDRQMFFGYNRFAHNTPVDLARNAGLYFGSELTYVDFGADFLAGTADDVTEVPARNVRYLVAGLSNSKIVYHLDYAGPGIPRIVVLGPGTNGVFNGLPPNGDDEQLMLNYYYPEDLAYDASFLLALQSNQPRLSLFDLRPINAPRGRLVGNPLDIFQPTVPPPGTIGSPNYYRQQSAIDGAFTTASGATIAGVYAVFTSFSRIGGGWVRLIEVHDTGVDGSFYTTDDFVRQIILSENDSVDAIDVKGHIVAFTGRIGGQRGLFVIPVV